MIHTTPASKSKTLGCGLNFLVEGVGAGAPVGEEDGKSNGLEELGEHVQADSLKWPLLGNELSKELDRMLAIIRRLPH